MEDSRALHSEFTALDRNGPRSLSGRVFPGGLQCSVCMMDDGR